MVVVTMETRARVGVRGVARCPPLLLSSMGVAGASRAVSYRTKMKAATKVASVPAIERNQQRSRRLPCSTALCVSLCTGNSTSGLQSCANTAKQSNHGNSARERQMKERAGWARRRVPTPLREKGCLVVGGAKSWGVGECDGLRKSLTSRAPKCKNNDLLDVLVNKAGKWGEEARTDISL